MTSPENTVAAPAASPEVATTSTTVRRSHARRLGVGLLAGLVVVLAATACNPEGVAKDAIAKAWGANAACAERIADRESNFQSTAVNRSSGTIGLFQIHPTHKAWVKRTFGYDWSELYDPHKNATVAAGLYAEAQRAYGDGWQPWRLSGRIIRGGGCPA